MKMEWTKPELKTYSTEELVSTIAANANSWDDNGPCNRWWGWGGW